MNKSILSDLRKAVESYCKRKNVKPYERVEIRKCESCGRKYRVYFNVFGSNSGFGTCKCGARTIIN